MKRRTTGLFAGALLAFGSGTTALAGFQQGQAAAIIDASSCANGDFHLIFGWNASRQCTSINAQNGSLTVPKQ